MKRRVNIGVGLLHKPRLLFMDEPTVGIDPQSRRAILDTVKDLNKQGMTVLYTTHYMEEAEELSNRVGIIDHAVNAKTIRGARSWSGRLFWQRLSKGNFRPSGFSPGSMRL